jgi:hypothetical protein
VANPLCLFNEPVGALSAEYTIQKTNGLNVEISTAGIVDVLGKGDRVPTWEDDEGDV